MDVNSFVIGYTKGKQSASGGGSAGGVELNIAYGDTPPEDTTKLWVKTSEPSGVVVSKDMETVAGSGGASTITPIVANSESENLRGAAIVAFGKLIYLIGGERGAKLTLFDTETEVYTTAALNTEQAYYDYLYGTIDNKVYLFGGSNASKKLKTVQCLDMESLVITTLSTTLPDYFVNGVTRVDGNLIYLFNRNKIYCFDTESETVETLEIESPKNTSYSACATVGKKTYIFGGRESSATTDTIMCFDSNTLTAEIVPATLPTPMVLIGAAVLGTNIYLFGGALETSSSPKTLYNTILRFDTINETLDVLPATLDYASYIFGSAVVSNKIYSFGKRRHATYYKYNVSYLFSEEVISIPEGTIQIVPSVGNNIFSVVNTEDIKIKIGVEKIYKGSENNEAEPVEAALYKDGAWTTI